MRSSGVMPDAAVALIGWALPFLGGAQPVLRGPWARVRGGSGQAETASEPRDGSGHQAPMVAGPYNNNPSGPRPVAPSCWRVLGHRGTLPRRPRPLRLCGWRIGLRGGVTGGPLLALALRGTLTLRGLPLCLVLARLVCAHVGHGTPSWARAEVGADRARAVGSGPARRCGADPVERLLAEPVRAASTPHRLHRLACLGEDRTAGVIADTPLCYAASPLTRCGRIASRMTRARACSTGVRRENRLALSGRPGAGRWGP